MKILVLGDVVGNHGASYLSEKLRAFKRQNDIDFTVVNGENSAKYNGIDAYSANLLLDAGADVITTGNHVYRIPAFNEYLDTTPFVLRPANYPDACAGKGYGIYDCGFKRILVINALGRINTEPANSPFDTIDAILEKEKGNYHIAILDLHAEATSEKAAVARYFDGRIQVVFGTHTHVQTNDARILPNGSGFITDLGMCGPVDSILGITPQIIIDRLRRQIPHRFEFASGEIVAHGAIFTLENDMVTSVTAIKF